jgi:Golgi phosphoprotein 3
VFTLAEQLFLLAIDDIHGITASGIDEELHNGLAGGVLADLVIQSKLASKEKRLVIINKTPTGDDLLDDILETITTAKKPHQAGQWISALASKNLNTRIAEHLVDKNILRVEEKRYLWALPFQVYQQQNASAKYWLKQHYRAVVLAGEKAEMQDVALLCLLKASNLLKMVFTKDERKWAQKTAKVMAAGDIFSLPVAQALADIEAALITATAQEH